MCVGVIRLDFGVCLDRVVYFILGMLYCGVLDCVVWRVITLCCVVVCCVSLGLNDGVGVRFGLCSERLL